MDLTNNELEFYSRSILLDDFGIEGQLRLKAASVFVFGCGGIGSPLVSLLAGCGVGNISICDFDTVQASNLQRQILFKFSQIGKSKAKCLAKAAKNLNPYININTFSKAINTKTYAFFEKILSQHSLIIDATDNYLSRNLINKLCVELGKPLISGACVGFQSHIYVLNASKADSACYNCIFDQPEEQQTCSAVGIFPPVALATACSMALCLAKQLQNKNFYNLMYSSNFATNACPDAKTTRLLKDPQCKTCSLLRPGC